MLGQIMEDSTVGLEIAAYDRKYRQRRKYFRMDCLIPSSFSLMEENESGESFLEESYDGLIRNLSGGGIGMTTEFEIAEEDLIKFTFQLDKEFFELIGEVKHKTHVYNSFLPYLYGVMFMRLSVRKREEIVSYLHRCQLESLQPLSRA